VPRLPYPILDPDIKVRARLDIAALLVLLLLLLLLCFKRLDGGLDRLQTAVEGAAVYAERLRLEPWACDVRGQLVRLPDAMGG
jgi:hypothetical protein